MRSGAAMPKPTFAWAVGWRTQRGRLVLVPDTVRRTRQQAWDAFAKFWDIPKDVAPVTFLKARKYDVYRVRLELDEVLEKSLGRPVAQIVAPTISIPAVVEGQTGYICAVDLQSMHGCSTRAGISTGNECPRAVVPGVGHLLGAIDPIGPAEDATGEFGEGVAVDSGRVVVHPHVLSVVPLHREGRQGDMVNVDGRGKGRDCLCSERSQVNHFAELFNGEAVCIGWDLGRPALDREGDLRPASFFFQFFLPPNSSTVSVDSQADDGMGPRQAHASRDGVDV